MAKKSKNNSSIIIVLIAIVIALVGVFVYAQQKDEPTQNQPTINRNCKTFKDKEYCAQDYIGLTESDALDKAKTDGLNARVVGRDGKGLIVNSDLVTNRLNFTVSNGSVTKVEFY